MIQSLLVGLLGTAWLAAAAAAGSGAQGAPLQVEGVLETDIVVVGGETTGTILRAGKERYELDLKGDAKLNQQAKQWNKQKVAVVGKLHKKAGIETGERRIIVVESLKEVK